VAAVVLQQYKHQNFYLTVGIFKMYNKSTKDPVVAAVTAGLGAGAVACFSVSQGQNVLVAIGVTVFATTVALIVDSLFFN